MGLQADNEKASWCIHTALLKVIKHNMQPASVQHKSAKSLWNGATGEENRDRVQLMEELVLHGRALQLP